MAAPLASVLIPTHNPGRAIRGVLASILSQQAPFEFEVVVVDSTSRPEDVASMREFPIRFEQIPQAEFGHGRTRNLLGELGRGEYLLYLSQDAEPASEAWLATLVEPLRDQ